MTPADVIAVLRDSDIESRHARTPLLLQPIYEDAKFVSVAESPVAEDLFNRGVGLPSDTKMRDGDVQRIIYVVKKCVHLKDFQLIVKNQIFL